MKKSFVLFLGMMLLVLVSCGKQVAPVENVETPVVPEPPVSEVPNIPVEENSTLGYDFAYSYIDQGEMLNYIKENNIGDDWKNYERVPGSKMYQFDNTKLFRFSDKTSIDLNGDFGNLGLSPSGDKIAFDTFDTEGAGNSNTYIYNILEDTKVLQNISKDFRNTLNWIDENSFSIDIFSDETIKVSTSSSDMQSYSGSLQWFENGKYIKFSENSDGKISYHSQDGNLIGEYNLNEIGGCSVGITSHKLVSPQTIVTFCDDTKIFGYDVENKNLTFKMSFLETPFSTLSSEYSFMDYRATKDTVIVRFDTRSEDGSGKGESVFFVYNIANKAFQEPLYEKDFTTSVRIVK